MLSKERDRHKRRKPQGKSKPKLAFVSPERIANFFDPIEEMSVFHLWTPPSAQDLK
jgi:hypothetical protein